MKLTNDHFAQLEAAKTRRIGTINKAHEVYAADVKRIANQSRIAESWVRLYAEGSGFPTRESLGVCGDEDMPPLALLHVWTDDDGEHQSEILPA